MTTAVLILNLLNAIGIAEGSRPGYWEGNPYDLTLGRGKYHKTKKPISTLTVGEVKKIQKEMVSNGAMSGAVGKYQFINKTLVGLQRKLGFKDTDIFSPELQDKMALELLKRRGLDEFVSGRLSIEKFLLNLSKEWASLPDPRTGKSYYGQRTHFSSKEMFDILLKASERL